MTLLRRIVLWTIVAGVGAVSGLARAPRAEAQLVRAPARSVVDPRAAKPQGDLEAQRTGEALYRDACAACHGPDGRGMPAERVGFDTPLPDFTDCSFATREPDADWFAVVHEGGPVRAFARIMPAYGDALTDDEIAATLAYIRTLCTDDRWPRGELNLPRALRTEKAYPEDEAVFTTNVALEGPSSVLNELVYEKRFGARNQVELSVPFGVQGREAAGRSFRLGDVAIGVKRALFHSLARGTILSAAGEFVLPTGGRDDGFGSGTTIFEPFVALGQILPQDAFFQFQGGVELPFDTDRADRAGFWRAALGRSFTEGGFGRVWTPMVELLGARSLQRSGATEWGLLPQLQVTLSTRQHVMANLGVEVPLNDGGPRPTRLWFYLLWDWFDGPLFEGW